MIMDGLGRPTTVLCSRITLALLLIFSLGACASSQPQAPDTPEDNELFELDGTWTGKMKGFSAPGLVPPPLDYEFWLTIRGDEATLWFKHEDQWALPWDGARPFTIARHKSNAVISASNSKPETQCHWVETWNLTVSQFTPASSKHSGTAP